MVEMKAGLRVHMLVDQMVGQLVVKRAILLVEPKEDNLVEVMADLLGFAMVGKMVELMVGQKVH